jgi:O-antigen/teichoic acid export membrane protein
MLSVFILVCFISEKSPSLVQLVSVQLMGIIAAAFFSYGQVKSVLKFSHDINKKLIGNLFHFGKYTFGTTMSSMFIKNTDSWMIGRMMSTAQVAMYNPALRISNIVEVPTLAITNLIFPQVHQRLIEQGTKGIQDIYLKSVSLILAVMLPFILPLYIFSDFIIVTVFGEPYRAASPVLQVTVFYTMIIPFNRQFGTVMDALKMPKINFLLLVLVALLNIIFNYFFIKKLGIIGAAYGTLCSYCIVFILNQWILYHKFRINVLKIPASILWWYRTGWEFLFARLRNR